MKYDLKKDFEKQCAQDYLNRLIERGATVEVKQIRRRRSSNQNSFVHVLFALWGMSTGYTIEEAKTEIKRALGYHYEKNGKKFLVKTSTLDTAEMAAFIDKFRRWSNDNDIYLPTSEEYGRDQNSYDNMIEQNSNLL